MRKSPSQRRKRRRRGRSLRMLRLRSSVLRVKLKSMRKKRL